MDIGQKGQIKCIINEIPGENHYCLQTWGK